ncbi:hypothetical protein Trydic_g20615, partial [Trypoxylus dichotomus]
MVTENGQSDGNTSFLRAARAGHLDKVLEHLKSNIDINTSNANGLNALHLASKDGHVDVVAELLKRGAVVDAATKKGNTALHIASLAGQEEVVKLLVQHGASVNVQSQNGFTPLYMAAQENHDNVVKYLLANGANQSLATEDGFTPLAVAMQQGHDKVVTVLLENDTRGKVRLPALHIAAKKDDVKAAKLLLENEHNPDVTSKSGFTPLHIASHYGNEAIANLLIHKGADVNYAAKHNITPLHVAAKWGKTNMVALLLEHGANIESKTRDGLTPLHCAARSGHEQVVDMLLERGAPISCKTKNGLAPLHMAAQGDHVDAARILLYHRAPVDEVTVDYLTALHVAAHCGHVRVAKLLLDRQADANARALNGFTPLHIACKKNRIKVVELLLKHGASIGATTESGLTPLHVASFMGCMNIVIYLLQHDANPDVPTVRGETPLHLAARANQTDIIRILLRNGAQVDARAREQQTPLHIASRLGNVDIVMLLLQHGAKVDTTTKDMYTALHIAAKEGQDEVAAVLIENGASLNATTKKGFTPLHLAAKYGNIKVAKLLLQKEAPVDAQGKNGVTPLHVASHYDHQNVALLLLDKGASPHATAKNGHTPLHIAARKNQMDIANTLLEYGAKPNAESKAGFTPLHLSAQEGHTDMSSLLIEHEANTNHPARNGLTPLHLCAQEDRVPVAEILVKNGAQVDSSTKGGFTPLHIASHYGQTNMVKFLLANGANVGAKTSLHYTPLHQAAQQGHTNIVNILLENSAQPNSVTMNGQTPLHIAQKLGYISVIETLKVVTETTTTTTTTTTIEEKYKVVAPEAMQETFMSDSEEEGGEEILDGFGAAPHEQHVYLPYFNGTTLLTREDTVLGDHSYRYLTADEMKSLGDDSLPIDVTRDERIDSNKMVISDEQQNALPPQAIEDGMSPQYITENYVEYTKKYSPDNVDLARHPINIGKLHWKNFLVSFLVDARGGAMRGCRHSGVRVIVPPRCAPSPTRITCRYVRPQRTPHPPPLMEGEALASRVLELGPVGAKFLGPVIIEVPHFAALRGKEREIVILRSDNGETWREHTVDASDDILNEVLNDSFEAEDLSQLEDVSSGRITRVVTNDFPQYFAIVTRIRQEVHAIGPEGGMVSSTVVPQVQAVFPQGALTKKIKVGLQAQPIDPELSAKLLGHGVALSPVVTVEPRRRKFHKAITLSMPAPRAHSQGMINQYSGNAPTLRLLCSITGGTTRAQWEDVTGSTPLTFVNDCVSFTTTVSARFWLMDCRNITDATKMATELYKEAIHVPFMAKFVVFAKRIDPLEARLRVFCMTDDKEDKTLEHQEHFTEVAKSRDVEVLEGKPQYIEFAGNLVPITKSGEPLQFSFRAFRENRLPFSVRVKDQHAEAVGRCLFMREPKVAKGEPPQQPICILNIVLPDDIVTETVALTDNETLKRHMFLKDNFEYYRPDPRLADMSNLLGEDWVPLATQLGLTPSEINVIKSEYPDSVAKQAQSMLRMWISQSGNKAQGDALEHALMRIGREDIIPQCLNVDDVERIPRIPKDVIERYQKDIDTALETSIKQKETYESKYSAEEKIVDEFPSDEEDFNKSVSERRQQIEKRLTERTIPASTQRQEIAEEITSIKRQSMVEDKIAEAEVKQKPDQTKTTTIIKTVTTEVPESKKTVAETVETTKTTITSDYQPTEVTVTKQFMEEEQPDRKTTVRTIITETRTTEHIPSNEIQLPTDVKADRRDSDLLEGVTQRLETTKKPRISAIDADPNSPKFSKTPPPSPADFIFREQAAVIQATASPQDDDDSLDTDGFREDQYLLETPTPSEDAADEADRLYLENYQHDRPYGNLESQDVTQYDDIRDYYKHQVRLFAGDRKRLASTEDLDSEYLAPTPDKLTGVVRVGVDGYKVIENDPARPGELKLTTISPEEKGVKDSKRPEDWERKEARKVERLQGGAGKTKTPGESTEQRTSVTFKDESGDIVVEKVTDVRMMEKDFGETGQYKTESIKITGMVEKGDEGKHIKFVKEESDVTAHVPHRLLSSVEQAATTQFTTRGTSPLDKPDPYNPKVPSATLSDNSHLVPTLELVIGRKEVHTKEASATAESRLTLYGTKDVEISIHSQSHISVVTTRKDTSGAETSEKVDVGVTARAGTGDSIIPEAHRKEDYIIQPGNVTEVTLKKREETVNFSGKKEVYRYDSTEKADKNLESPIDDSLSHHGSDTGISITRGTTDTLSSMKMMPGTTPGLQTTGFASDIADDVEQEEGELTDAGLSPIQADELPPIMDSETHFTEIGTSPIEFPESSSLALSHVDTSEAATLTDQIDTKDASNSPIRIEEAPVVVTETSKAEVEDVLDKRRGSGDVKAKIKFIEEQTKVTSHIEHLRRKREIVDSEDELSSLKEEEVLRGSTETLAQLDDTFEQIDIPEKVSKDIDSDADDRAISESLKPKERTHLTPKHVGPKIAELQKIFSKSSEFEDSDEESLSKKLPKIARFGVDVKPPSTIEIRSKTPEPITDTQPQVPVDEYEAEIEYKTVKQAKQMFESLISKSVEIQPSKKPKTPPPLEKTTEPCVEAIPPREPVKHSSPEKPLTEDEIRRRLSAVEDQIEKEIVVTEKEKTTEYVITTLDKAPTPPPGMPCLEPVCKKIIIHEIGPGKDIVKTEALKQADIESESKTLIIKYADYDKEKEMIELNGEIEDESIDSSIIKEVLLSNTRLVSAIALPSEVKETITTEDILKELRRSEERESQRESTSEKELTDITDISRDRTIDDLTEEIIPKTAAKEMKQRPTEFKIEDLKHDIISSSDVRKVISEVLEASRQIKADIKEIKPDLTPTPEGQQITIVATVPIDHLKDRDSPAEKKTEHIDDDSEKLKEEEALKEEKLQQSVLRLDEKIIKTFEPTFQINEIDKKVVKTMELVKKYSEDAYTKSIRDAAQTDKAKLRCDIHKKQDYKKDDTITKEKTHEETAEEEKFETFAQIRGKFEKLQKAQAQEVSKISEESQYLHDNRKVMKEKFEQQKSIFETTSKRPTTTTSIRRKLLATDKSDLPSVPAKTQHKPTQQPITEKTPTEDAPLTKEDLKKPKHAATKTDAGKPKQISPLKVTEVAGVTERMLPPLEKVEKHVPSERLVTRKVIETVTTTMVTREGEILEKPSAVS